LREWPGRLDMESDMALTNEEYPVREILIERLRSGTPIRCRAVGGSMFPTIRSGDYVVIVPAGPGEVSIGDVVAIERGEARLVVHRLIRKTANGRITFLITKGDGSFRKDVDRPVSSRQLLGKVTRVERGGRTIEFQTQRRKLAGKAISLAQRYCPAILRMYALLRRRSAPGARP